ncbi:MAG: hypothetical protein R3C10_23500 [Pirellulales bacterium]
MPDANGYFKDLTDAYPESRHAVDERLAEPQQLLLDIERTRAKLRQLADSGKLQLSLRGWISRFRDLDERETTLLQNA